MAGDDFVMVQLTTAGQAMAKGAAMRVSGLRRHFLFDPGKPLRVERSYEWSGILAQQFTPDGQEIFELAPTVAAEDVAEPGTPAAGDAQTSEESK